MREKKAVVEVDVADVTQDPNSLDVPLVTNPPDLTPRPVPSPPPPAKSDGNCPLLVTDPVAPTRVTETIGEGEAQVTVVHKEPFVELDRPVECPSCGKLFESHALPVDNYGTRDCVVAANYKTNPKYKAFFDAMYVSPELAAAEAAKFGPEGAKLFEVFVK